MRTAVYGLAILLLLVRASAAPGADLTPEQKQYIEANKARWSKIKTVQVAYQNPPKEWKKVSVQEFNASIAFPCEPKRATVDNGAAIITTYSCKDENVGYVLSHAKGKFGSDPEMFFAGSEFGAEQAATRGGEKITVVPIMRVQYSGLSGRELRLITTKFVMQRRSFLVNNTTMLDIQAVHGLSYTGDKPKSFFNSLQVQ